MLTFQPRAESCDVKFIVRPQRGGGEDWQVDFFYMEQMFVFSAGGTKKFIREQT